jgi:hypothetical protein
LGLKNETEIGYFCTSPQMHGPQPASWDWSSRLTSPSSDLCLECLRYGAHYSEYIKENRGVPRGARHKKQSFSGVDAICCRSEPAVFYTGSELSSKLVAPAPHRFVAEQHAASGHHLFHITKTHAKTASQPRIGRHLPKMLPQFRSKAA